MGQQYRPHPYLIDKGLTPQGCQVLRLWRGAVWQNVDDSQPRRIDDLWLLVPLYWRDRLVNVQRINTTGNGKLAIGGTGDVLAGLIGARMAQGLNAFDAACMAVHQHGRQADCWPAHQALTASALAMAAEGALAPTQPAAPESGQFVAPHPAPDGSGAMTNLSDEDYARFVARQAPPPHD